MFNFGRCGKIHRENSHENELVTSRRALGIFFFAKTLAKTRLVYKAVAILLEHHQFPLSSARTFKQLYLQAYRNHERF